jgi:hypothetical protein
VFSHQLLSNASRWRITTTLVEVVKVIVKYLNEPDPDYAVDFSKEFRIFIFYIGFFSMCRFVQRIHREQRRIQSKSIRSGQKKLVTTSLIMISGVGHSV